MLSYRPASRNRQVQCPLLAAAPALPPCNPTTGAQRAAATAPATGPRSGVVLPHTPNRLTHSRTHGSRAWDRDRFRREGVRLRGPCCHDLGCEITVSLKMQSRKTGGRGKGLRRGRTVGMVAARCDMPRVRVEASDRVVRVRNITAGRAGS